uniref:Denticleless protein homolog n=1 Tax=Physcomitrium patens TaxID=3218 RepID=A0A7I4AZV3_PHYPA
MFFSSAVRGRPHMGRLCSEGGSSGSGVLSVEHDGVPAPPLAVSYSKKRGDGHMLAVADEEGFVSIFNTRLQLPTFMATNYETDKIRLKSWMAHTNAIFDVSWIQDDTRILTASGDQTVRLWDVESHKALGVMRGHSGSVKSLCAHPSNAEIFASGSRDGSIALWDLRTSTTISGTEVTHYRPVSCVTDTHLAPRSKNVRRRKGATYSVTGVLYQQDERILATSGAADGVVKFWDTRKLKVPVVQTPSQHTRTSEGVGRVHGITSLSQDPTSSRLIASCTDSKIYMYDGAFPERGVISSFSGHIVGSFYIKAAFSPDSAHILSGSTDGNVYIWQVDNPSNPAVLEGHRGEVTAVDWCSSSCKIVTSSDDCMVRVWSLKEHEFTRHQLPSLFCHRLHCVSTSPSSTSNDDVSVIPETPQPKQPKSLASTPTSVLDSLSELHPNLPHGSSPRAKRDIRQVLSPVFDGRKRPRTIRDYFSHT